MRVAFAAPNASVIKIITVPRPHLIQALVHVVVNSLSTSDKTHALYITLLPDTSKPSHSGYPALNARHHGIDSNADNFVMVAASSYLSREHFQILQETFGYTWHLALPLAAFCMSRSPCWPASIHEAGETASFCSFHSVT